MPRAGGINRPLVRAVCRRVGRVERGPPRPAAVALPRPGRAQGSTSAGVVALGPRPEPAAEAGNDFALERPAHHLGPAVLLLGGQHAQELAAGGLPEVVRPAGLPAVRPPAAPGASGAAGP